MDNTDKYTETGFKNTELSFLNVYYFLKRSKLIIFFCVFTSALLSIIYVFIINNYKRTELLLTVDSGWAKAEINDITLKLNTLVNNMSNFSYIFDNKEKKITYFLAQIGSNLQFSFDEENFKFRLTIDTKNPMNKVSLDNILKNINQLINRRNANVLEFFHVDASDSKKNYSEKEKYSQFLQLRLINDLKDNYKLEKSENYVRFIKERFSENVVLSENDLKDLNVKYYFLFLCTSEYIRLNHNNNLKYLNLITNEFIKLNVAASSYSELVNKIGGYFIPKIGDIKYDIISINNPLYIRSTQIIISGIIFGFFISIFISLSMIVIGNNLFPKKPKETFNT